VRPKSPITRVVAWHSPECDACGEEIDSTENAFVECVDEAGSPVAPRIVHDFQAKEGCRRREDLGAVGFPLEQIRQNPGELVRIALKGAAHDPTSVDVWHRWVMSALGLPLLVGSDGTGAGVWEMAHSVVSERPKEPLASALDDPP
jgi:hypothetical protein